MRNSLVGLGAILALAVLGPCGETASARKATRHPAWLQKLVSDFEAHPVANPPASVVEYEHGGKLFYYLPPQCCDIPGVLYGGCVAPTADSRGAVMDSVRKGSRTLPKAR